VGLGPKDGFALDAEPLRHSTRCTGDQWWESRFLFADVIDWASGIDVFAYVADGSISSSVV
jgi:hypothetical protein